VRNWSRYRLPVGGIRSRRQALAALRSVFGGSRPDAEKLAVRARWIVDRIGCSADIVPATVRSRDGWANVGMSVRRGQHVTIHATGSLWIARLLGVGLGSDVGLWVRIGDGPALSMTGSAMVIAAEADGELRVLGAEPGVLDEQGELDANVRRFPLTGAYALVAIRWPEDADCEKALIAAAHLDPELFAAVAIRAGNPSRLPPGWSHHPRIGAAEIFTQTPSHGIDCRTKGDVGIICYPVDLPLADDLEIEWSWHVDMLPSALPENTEPTHDYLSVAVEFDDGRDLTWMWSCDLAVGTVFTCPLTYWRHRETHLVVRSGAADLGRDVIERRRIAEDCDLALCSPRPTRIVAVWLIANSAIQNSIASCRFIELTLSSVSEAQRVAIIGSPPTP